MQYEETIINGHEESGLFLGHHTVILGEFLLLSLFSYCCETENNLTHHVSQATLQSFSLYKC